MRKELYYVGIEDISDTVGDKPNTIEIKRQITTWSLTPMFYLHKRIYCVISIYIKPVYVLVE